MAGRSFRALPGFYVCLIVYVLEVWTVGGLGLIWVLAPSKSVYAEGSMSLVIAISGRFQIAGIKLEDTLPLVQHLS